MERTAVQRQIHETIIPNERAFVDSVNAVLNVQLKAADVFVEWGRRDLAEGLLEDLDDVLCLRQKLQMHIQSVECFSEKYTEDPESLTHVARLINEKTSQLQSRRFDPRETDEYETYKQCLAGQQSAQNEATAQAEWDDDELEVVDDDDCQVNNTQCPLTKKKVEDLVHPVQDQVGFVYEKEAIYREIGYLSKIRCPVAGTNHQIGRSDLKPAFGLIRNLKRKRRQDNSRSDNDVI